MALNFAKLKSAPVPPPPQALISEFAELIDLVGTLQEAAEPVMKEIKALQERLKPLKEAEIKLQSEIDALELGDDETDNEVGATFKVEVGKKGTSRKITDLAAVKKLMGAETFMKVATVTLKNIDDYLTPPEKAQCVTETRSCRGYKVIKRAA